MPAFEKSGIIIFALNVMLAERLAIDAGLLPWKPQRLCSAVDDLLQGKFMQAPWMRRKTLRLNRVESSGSGLSKRACQ